MPFKFTPSLIEDVLIIESKKFPDDRGYFREGFKSSEFSHYGIPADFPQDNYSYSRIGVIRGLHYQKAGFAQGKLVQVPVGKIFDVAVDIRHGSDTYGQSVSEILSSDNGRMLWIPPGFAHGFQALEESVVHYKVTTEYNPGSEGGIIWNDKDLGIQWPIEDPTLSEKDKVWPPLNDLE